MSKEKIKHNQNPVTTKVLEYLYDIDENYNRCGFQNKKFNEWNMFVCSFTFNHIKALIKRLEHDPNMTMSDNEWFNYRDNENK